MKKTITYFLIVGTILFIIGWAVKNSGFSIGKDAKEYTNLGIMYYYGQGVKQDYYKAAELFKKACDYERPI